MSAFKAGDALVYIRAGNPIETRWPATFVRDQRIGLSGHLRFVIRLDHNGHKRCVSPFSVVRA